MVDAAMRQLNETGFMHNRMRMLTASFLTKHLLIDWRWGEAYFAGKLLDYELSSNNGGWQWAAGCGCDAAPYLGSSTRLFSKRNSILKKFILKSGCLIFISRVIPSLLWNIVLPAKERSGFIRRRWRDMEYELWVMGYGIWDMDFSIIFNP